MRRRKIVELLREVRYICRTLIVVRCLGVLLHVAWPVQALERWPSGFRRRRIPASLPSSLGRAGAVRLRRTSWRRRRCSANQSNPAMEYVHVLWSEKLQEHYVGRTSNLLHRLNEHNGGSAAFTLRGAPWLMVHIEEFSSASEAAHRERFLKSGIGRAWLDDLLPKYRRSQT